MKPSRNGFVPRAGLLMHNWKRNYFHEWTAQRRRRFKTFGRQCRMYLLRLYTINLSPLQNHKVEVRLHPGLLEFQRRASLKVTPRYLGRGPTARGGLIYGDNSIIMVISLDGVWSYWGARCTGHSNPKKKRSTRVSVAELLPNLSRKGSLTKFNTHTHTREDIKLCGKMWKFNFHSSSFWNYKRTTLKNTIFGEQRSVQNS